MTMVKRSISLTEQQAEWVRSQVESGHYGNESEVLRELIRDRVAREEKILALQAAVIEGEKSGRGTRSMEDILAEAHRQYREKNA